MLDMQVLTLIRTMKENVTNATVATIGQMGSEVPSLMHYASQCPREAKLELLEISRSIIDKFKELVPEIVEDEGWATYEQVRAELDVIIRETRFAVR